VVPKLPIPTKAQWRSWSLPSKLTAIGTFLAFSMGIFAVFAYFVPYTPVRGLPTQTTPDLNAERITIPLVVRNELAFDAHIDPQLEFYLLRPETPVMDSAIEAGVVRLEQPRTVTAINGNYALSRNEEMLSHFSLPASLTLKKALDTGGFKLRVRVTNRWIEHYSEFQDVLFDQKTLERGIRITFYKERDN
jgi:hypothetical protein